MKDEILITLFIEWNLSFLILIKIMCYTTAFAERDIEAEPFVYYTKEICKYCSNIKHSHTFILIRSKLIQKLINTKTDERTLT